jgi:2-phosphosulfolactate phosphatase
VVCAGSAGRVTVEDFLGASAILSRLDKDGYLKAWRLNDAAWMALDFAERHEGGELEALKKGRAGRWFLENDMEEELEFVGDMGASGLVPEVVDGRLRPAKGSTKGSKEGSGG